MRLGVHDCERAPPVGLSLQLFLGKLDYRLDVLFFPGLSGSPVLQDYSCSAAVYDLSFTVLALRTSPACQPLANKFDNFV